MKIVLPIFWGKYGLPIPLTQVPLAIEMGKPIYLDNNMKDKSIEEQINSLHTKFIKEIIRLFERTKSRHGLKDVELVIE